MRQAAYPSFAPTLRATAGHLKPRGELLSQYSDLVGGHFKRVTAPYANPRLSPAVSSLFIHLPAGPYLK